jgi:hypothetical protein
MSCESIWLWWQYNSRYTAPKLLLRQAFITCSISLLVTCSSPSNQTLNMMSVGMLRYSFHTIKKWIYPTLAMKFAFLLSEALCWAGVSRYQLPSSAFDVEESVHQVVTLLYFRSAYCYWTLLEKRWFAVVSFVYRHIVIRHCGNVLLNNVKLKDLLEILRRWNACKFEDAVTSWQENLRRNSTRQITTNETQWWLCIRICSCGEFKCYIYISWILKFLATIGPKERFLFFAFTKSLWGTWHQSV